MSPPSAPSRIVVAIPVLNEAATLPAVLRAALSTGDWPVLVLDGGSTDGSAEIITRSAAHFPRLVPLPNPRRTQAHALNHAADWAADYGAEILVRLDAHARYPRGYVSTAARMVEATCSDSVVSLRLPDPDICASRWQRAAALFLRHPIGHRGVAYRNPKSRAGPVTHGHHAAFRLSAFLALGGYDTRLDAAEDLDYDRRLIAAGGRIFLQTSHAVTYLPRDRPVSIFQQYLRNGRGRHQCDPLPAPLRLTLLPVAILLTFLWPPPLLALALALLLCIHASRRSPQLSLHVTIVACAAYTGFALGRLGLTTRNFRRETISRRATVHRA